MIPTVSVAMATRNYGKYLPAAVESVFAQTFSDWELVIVDDGSTDQTPSAVRPFLTDRRVRYVRADRFHQSRAKNLSIRLGRGPFVAFLDADDVWLPTKLERQLTLFRERPGVGVVYARRIVMDEAGQRFPVQPVATPPRGRVLDRMYIQNHVCFSSAMVRRLVVDHVGAFDPRLDLATDFDFWLRVARHYEFEFVDDELVLYRTGHGNLSKKMSDRVATALSIMHRADTRYGVAEELPAAVVDEGYASTCRTIGFLIRASEPMTSARWYLRALRWGHNRRASARGLVASLLASLRRRQAHGVLENASVNI